MKFNKKYCPIHIPAIITLNPNSVPALENPVLVNLASEVSTIMTQITNESSTNKGKFVLLMVLVIVRFNGGFVLL